MNTYPTAAALAAAMKTEILALITDGTVPADVDSFSALHDYVDANMLGESLYGEFPEGDDAADELMDAWTAAFNPASNDVDAWLKAGRPEQGTLTITATVDLADFRRFLSNHQDMADVADSFNARLNEVFGSGPDVLTTVHVQSVRVEPQP